MVRSGLRRLFLLIAGCVVVTAFGSVIVGALVGASLDRALTLGFYLGGCFLLLAGFFVGNRGPARVKSEGQHTGGMLLPFGGGRNLRWASLGEQNETINASAVYIALGLILVAIGVALDSRHSLF